MRTAYFINSGIRQGFSRFKLAIYLWLIILPFALVAIVPLTSIVRNHLGHFYFSQPPFMPFELHLVEVFMANQNIFQPYLSLILTVIFLFGLLSIFLNAGVFGRMIDLEKKITFRDFLADGCHHFWQFFLTFISSLPFFVLIFLVYRLLALPLNLWIDNAITEWPVILGSNLKLLLAILFSTVFKLLFDLVRIIIASESKKVIPALGTALSFLKRHFFKLWWLYLITAFIFIIISLLFLLVGRLFTTNNAAGVLVIIILGQAYIFFRIFTRLVFIGLETSYYFENRGVQ